MTSQHHPLRASPDEFATADVLERIQAEELSRQPAPGRLRAADVLCVRAEGGSGDATSGGDGR